jgi:hypothetical protein
MVKLFLGGLAGMVLLVLFFYFGGPGYMRSFGAGTEEAGERLEKYGEQIKDSTRKTGKTVKKRAEDAKKTVDETFEKTKEKIKEYVK